MLLRTLLASVLALTSVAAFAQTTAAGPYYATPSWDQTMPTATRFVVLSNFDNQAVLDRETGLVWTQSIIGLSSSYAQMVGNCLAENFAGRQGFRIPTGAELLTLFNLQSSQSQGLPAGHPFLTPDSGTLWTSTPDGADTSRHYVLGFGRTVPPGFSPDANTVFHGAWCVRAPQSGGAG